MEISGEREEEKEKQGGKRRRMEEQERMEIYSRDAGGRASARSRVAITSSTGNSYPA
jgi:hypothetical protein